MPSPAAAAAAPTTPAPKHIYKILSSAPPTPLPATLPPSDLDKADGFIHLSTASQVPATASRFFASSQKLWLLQLRLDTYAADSNSDSGRGRIVWEEAVGLGVFPHLYGGDLGKGCVERVLEFGREDGEDWETVLEGLEG